MVVPFTTTSNILDFKLASYKFGCEFSFYFTYALLISTVLCALFFVAFVRCGLSRLNREMSVDYREFIQSFFGNQLKIQDKQL